MDVLTFISSVIAALAWPVTIYCLARLFRVRLSDLFDRIARLKYGDAEAEFREKLDAVSVKFEQAKQLPSREVQPTESGVPEIELARLSPRAAVLEAWTKVEHAAAKLLLRENVQVKHPGNASEMARQLRKIGILDDQTERIFTELRDLRNAAAHRANVEITMTEAARFIYAALGLANYFEHGKREEP